MIIDFRIRPPFKSFMGLKIVKNWQNVVPATPRDVRPTGFERRPVPSVDQADIDQMCIRDRSAAVHRHKGTTGARAGVVNGLGEQFLARAAFTEQKHRGMISGHEPGLIQHPRQRRGAPQNPVESIGPVSYTHLSSKAVSKR